ncbi:MAG TPA: pitrilysin family protein, partial [Thermoanaerobaculia bacterium]|nr:pitrilysin family protein [Thermoanaerobaculia bacterium]
GRGGLSHTLEHMLYKGTATIGTRDGTKEAQLRAEREAAEAEQKSLSATGAQGVAEKEERRATLEARIHELDQQERALWVTNELDLIYGRAGATALNAVTNPDSTAFFVSLPANKLELWFWMESDRLREPVFRDLAGEKQAIEAERQEALEGRGRFADEMRAFFWQGGSYGVPDLGTPEDVAGITAADAAKHFQTFYGAGNLTAVLVGHLDHQKVRELAERYFGRLPASPAPARPWQEPAPQTAERRRQVSYPGAPAVEILYRTVPFLAPDSYALEVAAGVLNARLYTSVVLTSPLVSSASAEQSSLKRGGFFTLSLEGTSTADPAMLEKTAAEKLAELAAHPVPEEELAAVKDRLTAQAYRQRIDPVSLLVQILEDAGMGDGTYVNSSAAHLKAVTAADIQRVAATYFRPENRTVETYVPGPPDQPGQPSPSASPGSSGGTVGTGGSGDSGARP